MPRKAQDLTNKRFGRLTALKRMPALPHNTWLCICECGKGTFVRAGNLMKPHGTRSCGCFKSELVTAKMYRHGYGKVEDRHPEYIAFMHAKERCTNPKAHNYRYYGGRGIEFRFASFPEFLRIVGPHPGPGYSIDRINNDGHYEPGNVRWATKSQQVRNRRAAKLSA